MIRELALNYANTLQSFRDRFGSLAAYFRFMNEAAQLRERVRQALAQAADQTRGRIQSALEESQAIRTDESGEELSRAVQSLIEGLGVTASLEQTPDIGRYSDRVLATFCSFIGLKDTL